MMRARVWWQTLVMVTVLCPSVWCLPSDDDSYGSRGFEDSPLTEVRAVEGGRVLLPCDLDPPTPGDTTLLVLFFRFDSVFPIYSLDARGLALLQGKQQASKPFQQRAYLKVSRGQQGLLLEKVHSEDKGEYRCRVDFRGSPTRNSRVMLNVMVPPRSMTITSDLDPGREVKTVAGPYTEGVEVTLACQVRGGDPRPKVTWWHEWSLLDNTSEVNTSHVVKNMLTLPPLTRADLNKTLTCQATNSELIIPMSASVVVDMHYPPRSVKLLEESEEELTLSEGRSRPIVCEAKGSRPPARLLWLSDGQQIPTQLLNVEEEVEGEVSRSILHFSSRASDDGAILTCRGFSPGLPKIVLEDSVQLSVFYKPRVEIDLELDSEDLEEGDDVTLECLLNANPPATSVEWEHNGIPLKNNTFLGTRASRTTLWMKNITKGSSGVYTCAATNDEGTTTSSPLQLDVKFLPTCAEDQHTSYGVGTMEEILVSCHVDSNPAPIDFRWAMNTSKGVMQLPLNLTSNSGRSSVVRYTPFSQLDFGELLCWAVNEVGRQREPCVFQVVAAAKPEAVSSCVAERNATMPASYVILSCVPGWDGGLNQSFILEVRQEAKEELLEDFRHAPEPQFFVRGLLKDVHYLLTIRAENARGLSPPITLSYCVKGASEANTLLVSHARNTLLVLMPFVVLLMGVLLVLTVYVGVGVLRASKERRKRCQKEGLYYSTALKVPPECHDAHAIVCGNNDYDKEELMKLPVESITPSAALECQDYLLNNYGNLTGSLETDLLLKEKLASLACLPPLPSSDSIGRCPTPSSICTTSSKSSSKSHSSSKSATSSLRSASTNNSSVTVALNPEYLNKRSAAEALYALVARLPQESAV
ncbi:synaptogenesis protein syg-2-like [Penaeus japonicus]|uniref:synaptogenesis protein syg-2-like n=1 Tax=Penaeus japonicus TaxID=27405 RepID=UPI001C7103BC|nr:synaptogenesis protein syg-2-like [Penaeus japonicus]